MNLCLRVYLMWYFTTSDIYSVTCVMSENVDIENKASMPVCFDQALKACFATFSKWILRKSGLCHLEFQCYRNRFLSVDSGTASDETRPMSGAEVAPRCSNERELHSI